MRIANLCQLLSRRLAWSNGAGRWLFVLPLLVAALAVANVQPVRAEMADYVGMDLDNSEVKLNDDNDFTQDTTITVNHAKRKFDLSMFAETAELKSDDNKSIKPIGGAIATSRLGSGATVWRGRLNLAQFPPTKRSRRF